MKKRQRREFAVWLTYPEMVTIREGIRYLDNRSEEEEAVLKILEKRIEDLKTGPLKGALCGN